ncbi:GNAT family N-acetyltransferase [Actinacidiphila paucisporea]|uniref:Predicted acetyltransferase n=1 Tax=Actinacidiphila paucisporea TaxID=310782 RepID=A0A1M6WX97_9ACTN|nr:GNAT family N-acetyltransferase [Actinacidiphila paucisporea]SHK98313.1 Predicted acetyltransferase [Actinacidiphila paucisporea]
MKIDLRVLAAEDWEEFALRLERAFGDAEDPEEMAMWRDFLPFERSIAAWADGGIVGTAGAFDFRMTVPGGTLLDAAGVTMVSVQPTHRRRGVLTAMMRRQLDDFRDRGLTVALLTASEPSIYGRFGYGAATRQLHGLIDTTRVSVAVPPGADAVRLRLVTPAEGVAACEAVYARLVPTRPGMLARQPQWERLPLMDPPSARGGFGARLCVLAEVDGEVRGYARYSVKAGGTRLGVPDSTVKLRDVEALDPVTYAALWRYLTEIDLAARLTFHNRPVDDPVQQIVSDIRRCDFGWRDGLYVRLVDLPAALAARAYTAPVDVVLDVEDAFCPWNTGRWRLAGDATGASCVRTSDPADLALGARELGTAYLGGHGLRALAGAGLVAELRPGALAEASAAFRSDLDPWLPHGF